MNCKKFKEILITDCIDGELSREQQKSADEHINACADCRQFKEDIMKNAVSPFKAVEKAAPPEYIWNNIRTAITENSRKSSALPSFFKRYMSFPRISVAVAAVILALGSFIYFTRPVKHPADPSGYSADENYFAYLYEGLENSDQDHIPAEDDDILS